MAQILKTFHNPDCIADEHSSFTALDCNRGIGVNTFRYLHCRKCGLFRLENVPADLGKFYPNEYYALPSLRQLAKTASSDLFKINLVKHFVHGTRLLEIGPAFGVFAYQAKIAGFEVDVIEMDQRCCEYLSQVIGVGATCSSSPHEALIDMSSHDVIALWHVIEHLPDPWSLLRNAADNLTTDGILMIATPNPEAWQFKVMGSSWPHIDAPRHLYLIPENTLSKYAASLGLERIHCSTTDSDAKSWNRFGWQRLLMNKFRNRWLQRAAFVLGYVVSACMAPFESREPSGSAYTVVFRKIKI